MNFRTGVRTALAVAGLALASSSADAQVNFSETYTLTPTQSVIYVPFTVTTAGDFRFRTMATEGSNDPQIFLIQGVPGSFGAVLAGDDDSCPDPICPLRDGGDQRNALIQFALGTGDFTLALSRFSFSAAEALAGTNTDVGMTLTTPLIIDSQNGMSTQLSTVPEPSSIALMATGLAGLLGAVRRRKLTS